MRSSVDLPQPLGPTMTMNSPSAISILTPWITWLLPNRFLTFCSDNVAMLFLALDHAANEQLLH